MYQLVKMKLSINRASGEDTITGELIKYAPDIVKEKSCNIYNKMFENHCDEINIGKSNLLSLQKPNKGKGPLKNLRPTNLLNTINNNLKKNTRKNRTIFISFSSCVQIKTINR